MQQENFLDPVTEEGKKVTDLIKTDRKGASELMESLTNEEQVSLVSHEAVRDPKGAQELLFLLEDERSKRIIEGLGDRTLFRLMKSQSSTHIGVLSLVNPDRVQSILDLDQELFSTKGLTDPQAAYHWMVSFLDEDDREFARRWKHIEVKVVASAFQDKIIKPGGASKEKADKEDEDPFPADFMVKLDRNELKPDDLDVTDEETLDILTRIYLVSPEYFNELVSLMIREDDLKARTAEEAFERIHDQVGDMTQFTEEAEEMFVPLED